MSILQFDIFDQSLLIRGEDTNGNFDYPEDWKEEGYAATANAILIELFDYEEPPMRLITRLITQKIRH